MALSICAAILAFSLVVSACHSHALQQGDHAGVGMVLLPHRKDSKWEYVESTDKTAVKTGFDACYPFSEGLGCTENGLGFGFINNEGKIGQYNY